MQNTDALGQTYKRNLWGQGLGLHLLETAPSESDAQPSSGQGLPGLRLVSVFQSLPLTLACTMGLSPVSQMFAVKFEDVQVAAPWSVLSVTWSDFELSSPCWEPEHGVD